MFFEAGLRFPCSPLVGDVLSLFQLEIHETTPTTFVRLAAFEWAFHLDGCEPDAKAFVVTHLASQREHPSPDRTDHVLAFISMTLWPWDEGSVPAKATKEHWGKKWYDECFYYNVGPESKLQSTRDMISNIPQPKIAIDGSTRSQMTLLRTIAQKS